MPPAGDLRTRSGNISRASLVTFIIEYGLFALCLLIGVLVRCYHFGAMPIGLNQDEASMGYDAFAILNSGIDRNGNSYPVYLVAWGSGMNAFASYAAIPFIKLFDLTVFSIRLPALCFGVASMIGFYFLSMAIANKPTALMALFLVAISPWHIMKSRWGLESNLFPDMLLLGVTFLVAGTRHSKMLLPAALCLGLSLYCYGAAYVVVPAFLFLTLLFCWRLFSLNIYTVFSVALLTLLALPCMLFLLINLYHWNTIHIGPITIPRLTSETRHEQLLQGAKFLHDVLPELLRRASNLTRLLITQDDGSDYNVMKFYGYMYQISLPFALIGLLTTIRDYAANRKMRSMVMVTWLMAAVILGILLDEINVNRINSIFFPIIYFTACGIMQCRILARGKIIISTIAVLYCVYFGFFTRAYFKVGYAFANSLVETLETARDTAPKGLVCMTEAANMPYIYTLFVYKTDARIYNSTVVYNYPDSPFRAAVRYQGFVFDLKNCPYDDAAVLIAYNHEFGNLPIPFAYERKQFQDYSIIIRSNP